ncbi:MAG: glycine oxidase ThiO [Rhodothermaceae bacterium]|nr:glycine oxidase ThiO [Rhodothermaceae bacterium]
MSEREAEVVVVGGGIVGLAVAWRLAQRGHTVDVFEQGELGRGASWAAAGMLAPTAELGFEELDLYRLGRESLRRWPTFAEELEAASGQPVGYDATGTLVVADDRDSTEALRRLYRFQQEHAAASTWLAGFEALDREPFLAPGLPAAVFSLEDHQVDPRAVAQALVRVLRAHVAVAVHEQITVQAIEPDAETSAVVLDDGTRIMARAVVLAAGAWTRRIAGLEPKPPVRPIKGQALALRVAEPFALRHVVRGPDAYLVPKADGRLIVGATSEEQGFDTRVTAGAVYRLLEGAVAVVPGVEELEVIETWAGLRPASRDHAPLLGFGAVPGVAFATGHYRHGVLLAPVTADEIAAAVEARLAGSVETSAWLAPFSPDRFS